MAQQPDKPDTRKPPTTPPGHGGTPPGQAGKPPDPVTPPASFKQAFTISVGVDAGTTVTAITLTNTTVSGPADNANKTVGNVAITTEPPGQQVTTPVVIEGVNASKFVLTNSGHAPCELKVGATSISAGNYAITLSITPTA